MLEATDGPSALALAAEERGPIGVVSDVVMPAMSGRELSEKLRATRPGLATILMSGYTQESEDGERLPDGAMMIPKPFAPYQLLRALRGAVTKPAAGP